MPHSPDEIESPEELRHHLELGSLAGLTVQGIDLSAVSLTDVDVTDALFVGCVLADPASLIQRGANVVPRFPDVPFSTHPGRLYTPEDMAAGFAEHGFEGMFDTVAYRYFVKQGGASPDVRTALAERLHDAGIDDALDELLEGWRRTRNGPVVGVMGGHAEARGSHGYRLAAQLSHRLSRAGALIITGGGPGVMEAANLGAYLAPTDDLSRVIDDLATAPNFRDHEPYTRRALDIRAEFEPGGISLAVPTWLYGHEPANLFASQIAKYFSNAIREDVILRLARGGLVFAEGRAGTVQEVFQAATKTFYATDGPSGPFVFLNKKYWTEQLPIEALLRPLLRDTTQGDLTDLLLITDDPAEACAALLAQRS